MTRARQLPCDPGYYCVQGVRRPCPAGTYSSAPQETRPQCAGRCAPGYFCPLASTNSTAQRCGDASVYCPEGSGVPTPVLPGYYTIRSLTSQALSPVGSVVYTALNATSNEAIRDAQQRCEPGYFCVMGRKFICPGGRYGDQAGETSPLCAGLCRRGFFCPPGSTSPTQQRCGGGDRVCRTGSERPQIVPPGYYSVGAAADPTNSTRFHQRPCEPGFFCVNGTKFQCPEGTFGATTGLSTAACSGRCRAGYRCPSYPFAPSTSATQELCGNASVFCPEGTGNAPRLVASGFYSTGAGDGSDQEGTPEAAQTNATRTDQSLCPRGFYCRQGIRIRCPPGTYGDREGLVSTQCAGWCPPGFACPTGTSDYRANACPNGTYAVAGSAACLACSSQLQGIPASFQLVFDPVRVLAKDASGVATLVQPQRLHRQARVLLLRLRPKRRLTVWLQRRQLLNVYAVKNLDLVVYGCCTDSLSNAFRALLIRT
ncbi:hypothetical protein PINS_up006895 [Pythium insidiosum]|nr:hypothetical protein PINS_up006895 [Pythium insidiosum]